MRAKRYSFQTDGLFTIVLLGCFTGLMMLVSCRPAALDVALKRDEPIQIAPGASERRELAGGAREIFGIALNKDQLLRVSIVKGDLLLATTLYSPTGVKLLEHVSQDFENVELSFPAQIAGAYTIELQSQESGPRQYELKAQPLTPVTVENQKDSEARQAMAHGELLRAKSVAASFREATEQFDKATLIWTSIGEFSGAAHAALKSGNSYFFLSEYQEASKRYQNADALAAKAGDWLAKAKALSRMGRAHSFLGNNDLAQKQLTDALDLFQQHEAGRNAFATNAYGEALTNLAEVSYSKGNFIKSLDQLESAVKVFQHYRKGEARARLLLGQLTGSIGETGRAVAELTKARELYQSVNDRNGEMLANTTLELAPSGAGNKDPEIEVRLKAIEVFQSSGDRQSEATALNSLGSSYDTFRQYDIAIEYYDKALKLFQGIGSVDGATTATLQLAIAHSANEKPDEALIYYKRCLELARSAGNARDETYALNGIAGIYASKGLHKEAAAQYQKVLKSHELIGDLRGQAMALNGYGDSLLQLGQKQEALDVYNRALSFSEAVGERGILISALYGLARVHLELGSPEVALSVIQRSLNIIEDLRANVESPEFRVSYFSGVQQHYELCISILMQLEKLKPGQGFAAEAFAMSERSRARLLIELVTESRFNLRTGAPADLLERERKLRGLLRAQAAYKIDLSFDKNAQAEIAQVDNEMVQLRADYQAVLARLTRQQPRLFQLEQVPSLDLRRIQNELRGSNTMLLEYSLGETSSYLWLVTSDSLKFYDLPARKTIEDAAREYYKSLTARQGVEGQVNKDYQRSVAEADELLAGKAAHLSGLIFGPLAGQFETERLLVVAEGALQYIPFDALPAPGGKSDTLLLESKEVVMLPSFATLIAIRGQHNRAGSTRKLVAVIADPVFSGNDDRVADNATLPKKSYFNRLAHASEEAEAISGVAPWGTTMVAKGFEASRETAMSSNVGQYQIVHFATHAFEDDKYPELSSVVLSMVDRQGKQTDGVMPLHDIYSLDLSAELTVLSACQTALGKDTVGEGLVGLTHGFISANSKTVVASLWKVDDRATAVLMAHFYEAMLQQGMSPAAALRSAKLRMMRDKNWNAPYYWAGFVVQGEYENHIAVDQRTLLRFALPLLFLVVLIAAGLLVFQKRKRRFSPPQSS